METENEKINWIWGENLTKEEIHKYIADKAKEATIKEYISSFLDKKKGIDYEELKDLYDYMCGR